MNIVALDLSLTGTGHAVARDGHRTFGVIRTTLKDRARVDRILTTIDLLVAPPGDLDSHAHLVVLEGPSLHSQGRGTCDRWGLRGVVLYHLWSKRIPYVEIAPALLKRYATGRGNAPKDAVIAHAIRQLEFGGSDNNEADAWVLLHMAEAAYGLRDRPQAAMRRDAIEKVAWPENVRRNA